MTNIADSPQISICIPIYGVENYIEKCARSVFEQTYKNIEFIFVNDCTKDNSINILNRVILDYPELKESIRIINHKINKGLSGARNTALENAGGEFILWVDSDDYIDKTIVSRLLLKQKENDSDLVVSDAFRCYPSHREYVSLLSSSTSRDYLHKVLCDETEHWIWGKLIRKKLYTDHKIKAKEGINMGEDLQVLPQLIYYANRIDFVKQPLYYYMLSNTNSYGHMVSEAIQLQRWQSFEVLESFFCSSEFQSDLEYQKLQMCYFQFKTYLVNVGLSDAYYELLCRRLQEVSKTVYRSYPLYKRVLISNFRHEKQNARIGYHKKLILSAYVYIINGANFLYRYIKSCRGW